MCDQKCCGDQNCIPLGFQLPVDPDVVLKLIRAAGPKGMQEASIVRQTGAAPTGTTTSISHSVASGRVELATGPITIQSDYYGSDVQVRIYIDDVLISSGALTLNGPLEFELPYPAGRSVRVDVINSSGATVNVTFDYEALSLQKSYYEDFYRPLIEGSYAVLASYSKIEAEKLKAGRC